MMYVMFLCILKLASGKDKIISPPVSDVTCATLCNVDLDIPATQVMNSCSF